MRILSAPSNLGLRPPEPGSVPGAGAGKAPEALREAGLWRRLAPVEDLGVVLPGRYRDDRAPGEERLRNHAAIVEHARRLADRLARAGGPTLVLGGDCSILVGVGMCLRRRGRYGLVHIDGHTDFRNPANSDACASLAGEDLAAVTGRHWAGISDLDGLGPYFRPEDVVQVGARPDDEHLDEVRGTGIRVLTAPEVEVGPVREVVDRPELDGYWLHLDVDVLDPSVLGAVDSPAPGGLTLETLTAVLANLWPRTAGLDVTVFDPDLDPGGREARLLTDLLATALT